MLHLQYMYINKHTCIEVSKHYVAAPHALNTGVVKIATTVSDNILQDGTFTDSTVHS